MCDITQGVNSTPIVILHTTLGILAVDLKVSLSKSYCVLFITFSRPRSFFRGTFLQFVKGHFEGILFWQVLLVVMVAFQ